MTKKEVESLLKKHFGNIENKEEFMNDLFDKNENYLIKGQLCDEYGALVDDIQNALHFNVLVELMGECFFATIYNQEHEDFVEDVDGVSFWYYYKEDNDDDVLIFHCKSNEIGCEFELSNNYGGVKETLSVERIQQLIKTQLSIKRLFNLQ